jgi:hypothetical protein
VAGSSQFTENFQEFTRDNYFQTGKLKTMPFSLQQMGTDATFGGFENFVDVPPLQFTDNSGVTNAALYTKFGLISVDMKFNSPVFAWGANFYGAQASELVNLVVLDTSGNTISTVPVTVDTGFFGIVITPSEGIGDILFESQIENPDPSIGQGFGLEQVVGACTGTCITGAVTYNPSSVNFGNVSLGTKTASKLVTVTNSTASVATLVSETGVSEFGAMTGSTCGATLAAGATCIFYVYFAPTVAGPATGILTDSTADGPVTFTMSGTGVGGAVVYSPASVSFGDVEVGTDSVTKQVTVTNTTASTAVLASSAGLSEFASMPGSTCGESLAAGTSCQFNVYFAPTADGAANGSITVSTANGPVTFTMSGIGVGTAKLPAERESAGSRVNGLPTNAPISAVSDLDPLQSRSVTLSGSAIRPGISPAVRPVIRKTVPQSGYR